MTTEYASALVAPLELRRYNNLSYPEGYTAQVQEVAAHFDKDSIEPQRAYSLHTEYSYGKRKFNTELISKYPALISANKDGVPQLWKSAAWASEFADFIVDLVGGHSAPTIVEIHPPFNDYCSLAEFADRFRIFERKIHEAYPDVIVVIENRAGSVYHGGRFLVGKAEENFIFAYEYECEAVFCSEEYGCAKHAHIKISKKSGSD